MSYSPTLEQQIVLEARDPVLVVLGGAGVGKTATAAALARAHLAGQDATRVKGAASARVLFLSFSRASIAQITSRSADVLGPYRDRVEITTFHALAWRLAQRYGSALGHPQPRLLSPAEARLLGGDGLEYDDLVPLALSAAALPAAQAHLRKRWTLVICDEFQDTNDEQFELLLTLRGTARFVLLGDLNQCIYTRLPGAAGVGPERLAAAQALPGARTIELPEKSHRDPSGIIPAAAAAIARREFNHPAVAAAIVGGRLEVRTGLEPATEAAEVAETVTRLRELGSVAVFSHHIDSTAVLSDRLLTAGVAHEIVGLPDALGGALDAQGAMVGFALGGTTWMEVQHRLAVFLTSAVRGKAVPELANMLLGVKSLPETLARKLRALEVSLPGAAPQDAARLAAAAHRDLGLTTAGHAWDRAAGLLTPIVRASARGPGAPPAVAARISTQVAQRRVAVLTHDVPDAREQVQLMGLYQSKGREADSTVVVLRGTDFFGKEAEPHPEGSRLLYVLYTRARERIVTLAFGDELPPLIAPLTRL